MQLLLDSSLLLHDCDGCPPLHEHWRDEPTHMEKLCQFVLLPLNFNLVMPAAKHFLEKLSPCNYCSHSFVRARGQPSLCSRLGVELCVCCKEIVWFLRNLRFIAKGYKLSLLNNLLLNYRQAWIGLLGGGISRDHETLVDFWPLRLVGELPLRHSVEGRVILLCWL